MWFSSRVSFTSEGSRDETDTDFGQSSAVLMIYQANPALEPAEAQIQIGQVGQGPKISSVDWAPL